MPDPRPSSVTQVGLPDAREAPPVLAAITDPVSSWGPTQPDERISLIFHRARDRRAGVFHVLQHLARTRSNARTRSFSAYRAPRPNRPDAFVAFAPSCSQCSHYMRTWSAACQQFSLCLSFEVRQDEPRDI